MADTGAPWNIPYAEPTDLVRDWPALSEDVADAVAAGLSAAVPAEAFLYVGTRYYTSSGTFAKADAFGDGSNVVPRALMVTLIGAGGGSGAVPATVGGQSGIAGSGGGGSGCRTFITNIAGLSSSETITRGGGGSGGTGGASGDDGGDSIAFGATAPGGLGGEAGAVLTNNQTRGGNDNKAPSGTFDLELHGAGAATSMTINAGANLSVIAGKPGTSWLGGRLGATRDVAAAAPGLVAGEGSRAPASRQNTSAADGAAGANGTVIIDIYV